MSKLRVYKLYADGTGINAQCEGAVFRSFFHDTEEQYDRFFEALVWANAQNFKRSDTILIYENTYEQDGHTATGIDKVALINALFGRKLRLYINHKTHNDEYVCQGVHS